MTTPYKVFKETALPATLQPHAIYLVAPTAQPDYVEIYVTNAAGDASRRTPRIPDIQAMIDSAVATAGQQQLFVVDDIAARDALAPTSVIKAIVIDATADATVDTGGATYVYNPATTTWIKTGEEESMDAIVDWSTLTGGPTASAAAIDAAVANRHTHANKTQLDSIDEDGAGNMTYNGALPATGWASTGW